MVAPGVAPAAEVVIDAALVRALVDGQLPEASDLPLGDRYEGWDCVTWRLGDDWAVRLPRRQAAADVQFSELVWLVRLGPTFPFRSPVPVKIGTPTADFPWRWTVVPWIPGTTAYDTPLNARGARQFGEALRALHQPAPPEAPHNQYRSISLLQRSHRTQKRLEALEPIARRGGWRLDIEGAWRIYERGTTISRPRPTWAHLDLHGENLISRSGELAGIVDWTDFAAADAATDLGQALVLLPSSQWDEFIEGYGGFDGATFTRIRAEAVAYALLLATIHGNHTNAGWSALNELGLMERTP